jgi:hypothetical protein
MGGYVRCMVRPGLVCHSRSSRRALLDGNALSPLLAVRRLGHVASSKLPTSFVCVQDGGGTARGHAPRMLVVPPRLSVRCCRDVRVGDWCVGGILGEAESTAWEPRAGLGRNGSWRGECQVIGWVAGSCTGRRARTRRPSGRSCEALAETAEAGVSRQAEWGSDGGSGPWLAGCHCLASPGGTVSDGLDGPGRGRRRV